MNKTWTIIYNDVEKPLADWGITAATGASANQSPDTLRLEVEADYKGPPLFASGQTLELYRNDASGPRREFFGRIVKVPRSATGPAHATAYEAAGPWWYLENKVYREFWSSAGAYKTRAVLSYDQEDTKMSAAATLAAVFNYVIAAGAPIAMGDLSAISGSIPAEEVANLTCAEVVTRILRWFPDAVVWFDADVEGWPTVNISRTASAATVDFSLATDVLENLEYIERDDVRKDGVSIQYERIDTSDGEQTEVVITDTAGDVSGFNVLEVTVSLIGAQVSWLRQYLRSETIDIASEQWWREHVPELAGIAQDKIHIVSSGIEQPSSSVSREVLEGAHAEWMGGESGTVKVSATLEFEVGGVKETGDFALELRGTSKPTGQYSTVGSETPCEPTPGGLAQSLFEALDHDHWSGSFTVVDQVARRWDLVGKSVRVYDRTGGLLFGPAQVQATSVDLANGSTTVQFGPTPMLSAGDLVSLLRASRGRTAAITWLKTGGDENDTTATTPGTGTANNNSGHRSPRRHTIVDPSGYNITVDLASLPFTPPQT